MLANGPVRLRKETIKLPVAKSFWRARQIERSST